MLDLINDNVQFSDKIINDLLDYSRNIQLDLIKISPRSIIGDSLKMIIFPATVIFTDLSQGTPQVELDPIKIKRAFVNIIKNALDAMPQGGEFIIKSESDGDIVKFVFTDTGEGISEENLKKLFQPLFTTKAKGMGFGLAICQRIIEAHKGRILVESTLGNGTSVKVELPIKNDQ